MSKWYLIVFMFLFASAAFPQDWKAGGDLNLFLSTGELDYQFGPGFNLQYAPRDFPMALQGTVRYSFGSSVCQFNSRTAGGRIIVFPFENSAYKVKPFLSAGVLYNWYTVNEQNEKNPIRIITGIENSYSAEFSLGVNLNPSSRNTNYIFEFAYSYGKPWYKYKTGGPSQPLSTEIYRDRFNFSAVMFRFGMLFSS